MKALTCLALIALCCAGLSASYYFLYFLPESREKSEQRDREAKESERVFEMNQKCQDEGAKFYKRFVQENNDRGISWDEPEYHYSRKLNTCLVHTRYINQVFEGISHQYNDVHDIFTNRIVIQGHFSRSVKEHTEKLMDTLEDAPNYLATEYFKQKDKLFRE